MNPALSNSRPLASAEPRVLARLERTARAIGAVLIVAGSSFLAMGIAQLAWLERLAPTLATIPPATALGFASAGLALRLLPRAAPALACASLVAVLGALVLAQHALGAFAEGEAPGLALLSEKAFAAAASRTTPVEALVLFLAGIALAALAARARPPRALVRVTAHAALFLAASAVLGYAYDAISFSRLPFYGPLAPYSVLLQGMLATATFFAAECRLGPSLFTSAGPGGKMLRRLLPLSFLAVAILSVLRLQGERAGLYSFEVGLALMVTSAMAVLAALAWRIARDLERFDRARARREHELRASESRLASVLASIGEGVISLDSDFRIVLFNPAAERIFGYAERDLLGQPLDRLIPPRWREEHREYLRAFAAGDPSPRTMGRYGTIHGLRADGETIPLEATIARSGEGGARLLTVVLRDVSERLRTEQALRTYSEELQRLSRQLFETEERLRQQLARELHDRIGQNITALSLNLNLLRAELPPEAARQAAARLEDCDTLLYATGQLVRDVMGELRPPGLDQLGLVAALTEHARQVAARSGLAIAVTGTEPAPRLPALTAIALFRIAQEALNNVVKHAHATEVAIVLETEEQGVILTVADNGCGFEVERGRATTSLGLVGMRERAEAIGGRFEVHSTPGGGTRVVVAAPRTVPTPSLRPRPEPDPAPA